MPTTAHAPAARRPAVPAWIAATAGILLAFGVAARAETKARPPAGGADATGEVARFCANVAPVAAEARVAWQARRLGALESEVKQRIAELEKVEAAAREWVMKRETMLAAAKDDVVAIYAKMDPEAAATQIAGMDDDAAAAILAKLKPTVAGAILNEMEVTRAGRLAAAMSGAGAAQKKS